jgi:polysaccharide export outer membrane protein
MANGIVKTAITMLTAFALLSGCGAIYHSQNVVSGIDDGAKVRIVGMTPESVLVANRSNFTPKALPSVFSQTAGLQGRQLGAGALPTPAYEQQVRPNALQTTLPPATQLRPYKIGVGDVLLLATPTGSSVEELTGLLAAQNNRQGYTVQDDGAIAIPNVGRVRIADLTIEEAESALFQKLVEAQIDPTFSIEISQFNSQKVSVGGAVSKPGSTPITLTPRYLDEVITNAGGVTADDIDYVAVRLYRQGTLYQVPLKELYTIAGTQRILMQSGDIVFVDVEYELDQADAYFQQQVQLAEFRQSSRIDALSALNTEISLRRAQLSEARSNFTASNSLDAVDRDYVYLTGEVKSSGRFTLPFGRKATLADALFEGARGLNSISSDPREIYVLRGSDDPLEFGSVTAWNLNATNAAMMLLASRFEMRPNDVVFVSEKPVTRWKRTIDQITPTILNIGATAAN